MLQSEMSVLPTAIWSLQEQGGVQKEPSRADPSAHDEDTWYHEGLQPTEPHRLDAYVSLGLVPPPGEEPTQWLWLWCVVPVHSAGLGRQLHRCHSTVRRKWGSKTSDSYPSAKLCKHCALLWWMNAVKERRGPEAQWRTAICIINTDLHSTWPRLW